MIPTESCLAVNVLGTNTIVLSIVREFFGFHHFSKIYRSKIVTNKVDKIFLLKISCSIPLYYYYKILDKKMLEEVFPHVANLTRTLRRDGIDVYVVCNESGDGDFSGISPTNKENSEILLQIVDKIKPDIVHVHFEGAFYGLVLQPFPSCKLLLCLSAPYSLVKCCAQVAHTHVILPNFYFLLII